MKKRIFILGLALLYSFVLYAAPNYNNGNGTILFEEIKDNKKTEIRKLEMEITETYSLNEESKIIYDDYKTCKEIGSKLSFAYKRDSEPISREHNKTKVALSMRISRAKKKNDFEEIDKVSKHLEKYLSNYQKKLNDYNKHKISEEELINWIISQKEI